MDTNTINNLFLQALRAASKNEPVDWTAPIPAQDWAALFEAAEKHHVLPMIFEAVYACPAAAGADAAVLRAARQRTVQYVTRQTVQTRDFLALYAALAARGVRPLVVKGIVCRALYPRPDDRLSGDEDLLIPPEQFALCHQALLELGMTPAAPEQDVAAADEVPYVRDGSPLYIELHKSLFPRESAAYGDLNRFFADVQARAVPFETDGAELLTMEPTDHLLYLTCHAFKHFLHSGFGIRQVCDICLFANANGGALDWGYVLARCEEIRAARFAAALFQIGEKYLTFDPAAAHYPAAWRAIAVDEGPLLDDLLDAGVYGGGSMSRKHSSNITLHAVSAQKRGKGAGGGVLKTAFPPAASLRGRYPYLRRHPYLLPVAWADRLLKYRRETGTLRDDTAAGAVEIGARRVELLREYGIL